MFFFLQCVCLLASGASASFSFSGQAFSAYPEYSGGIVASASEITLEWSGTEVTISYTNLVADESCTTADNNTMNSCGIHIHEGEGCDDSVRGHYYNTDLFSSDPWLSAHYEPGTGSLTVDYGYTWADSKQRTFVIHDRTGTRIACELLIPAVLSAEGEFVVYPGYTGDVVGVEGTVSVDLTDPANAQFSFVLDVADIGCTNDDIRSGNECGIHIHEGFSCDEAGGHLYAIDTDPWTDVRYSADDDNNVTVDMSGLSYMDVVSRVVVVHDATGARIACTNLLEFSQTGSILLEVAGPLSSYPGYTGDIEVSASSITLGWDHSEDEAVDISWTNLVADPECTSVDPNATNSCGIHIHSGRTCFSHDEVGGHFYESDVEDPWLTVDYTAGSSGSVSVTTGEYFAYTVGRVLVIHDRTGARISCSILVPSMDVETLSAGSLDTYPGYTGDVAVTFDMIQVGYREDSVTISYENLAADSACTTADLSTSNSCGIHIHEGFTCDDAAGHFFDESVTTDPWLRAYYVPGTASVTVAHAYNYASTRGRVLVVHDRTGARIGCTPLTDLTTYTIEQMDLPVYDGYTGGLTVNVRTGLMFTGTGVSIAYDITGDPECSMANTEADNSCGFHLHTGATCPTGGHFFDESVSDPWLTAYYTADSSNGMHVENAKSWDDTWNYAALVVHDRAGARIACTTLATDCTDDADDLLAASSMTCASVLGLLEVVGGDCDSDLEAYGFSGFTLAPLCPGTCLAECQEEDTATSTDADTVTSTDADTETEMDYSILCANTSTYDTACDPVIAPALVSFGVTGQPVLETLLPFCEVEDSLLGINVIVTAGNAGQPCCSDLKSFCEGDYGDDDDDDDEELDAASSMSVGLAFVAATAAAMWA